MHNALLTLVNHGWTEAGYEYVTADGPRPREQLMIEAIGSGNAELMNAFTELARGVGAYGKETAVAEVLEIVWDILSAPESRTISSCAKAYLVTGALRLQLVQPLIELRNTQTDPTVREWLWRLAEALVTCPPTSGRHGPQPAPRPPHRRRQLRGAAPATDLQDRLERWERESALLAEKLLADTIVKQRIGRDTLTIHADNGSSMASKPVAFLLADLGVTKTHSRPHTSNDCPTRRRSSGP